MIKPQTITEELLYTTIRIETPSGSVGTGFFFRFKGDMFPYPIIITNKHVIENQKQLQANFSLHTSKDGEISENSININYNTNWYFHPSQDLCFTFAGPLFNEINKQFSIDAFLKHFDNEQIWADSKLQDLSAVEDVLMVGYPNGLWDEKNNYPIFRRGITASHPATDFNDKSIGVVDMACFPGSSGSPIFILNEGSYTDKKGTTHLGARRFLLLGVLFSGPQVTQEGEIVIKDIPTQQKAITEIKSMINIGYYIKAEEILHFEEMLKSLTKGNENIVK